MNADNFGESHFTIEQKITLLLESKLEYLQCFNPIVDLIL